MMNQLKAEILACAENQYPREMCGFIVFSGGENQFMPCTNVAAEPEDYFEIAPEDWIAAEGAGEIVALVHSHPDGDMRLSLADRQMQLNSGLDWWVVCGDDVQIFPKIAPLVGREFAHGATDCYTLMRDFYFLAGADLPDFARSDDWWHNGQNLYLDNMAQHGFTRVDSPQLGDVILMQVGASVPNHAGIYVGDQMVLHHSPRRLSKRDLYDGYWLKHTHSIWRFSQWSQLNFTAALNALATSSI